MTSRTGSSPRVRGTQRQPDAARTRRRFIPACAGNAPIARTSNILPPVHPRVCGERVSVEEADQFVAGSSPRVRGTRRRSARRTARQRFIPACAGNAAGPRWWWRYSAVHPRVCGERINRTAAGVSRSGSSPRVRGTRLGSGYRDGAVRFIPACAGNATGKAHTLAAEAVHPRVCGERQSGHFWWRPGGGSSPRVRGTPPRRRRAGWPARFIPACAGNAPDSRSGTTCAPVHPRVCGERLRQAGADDAAVGSSPRVRGTPGRRRYRRRSGRFIPACAGNAVRAMRLARSPPVHPRVCGERFVFLPRPFFAGGSSPRVRGTRLHGRFYSG